MTPSPTVDQRITRANQKASTALVAARIALGAAGVLIIINLALFLVLGLGLVACLCSGRDRSSTPGEHES